MHHPWMLKTLCIALLATCLVACDDGDGDTTLTDTSTTNDTATADTAVDEDTADTSVEQDTTTTADTTVDDDTTDTTTGDVADTTDTTTDATDAPDVEADVPCDPGAIVAEAIATHTDAQASGLVALTDDGGVLGGTIDASSGGAAMAADMSWVYVDFLSGAQVELGDAAAHADATWTIAFRRAGIRLNSGDSGPGPWLVTEVRGTSFDDLTTPPGMDAMWTQDDLVVEETCALNADERGNLHTAMAAWYDYDPVTHVVSPTADLVYVFYHPGTHQVYKLGIDAWDAGTYTVRWSQM